jgi:putative redox protein
MADQIKIEVKQVSDSGSEAAIREHRALFDRPVAKGGADSGPMGGEMFLASVAGCFMSNLLAAMRAREISGTNVRTSVTGTLEGAPPRFVRIELAVSGDGVERETMEKLVEIAGRGCIMVNTLRDKMDLSIRLT